MISTADAIGICVICVGFVAYLVWSDETSRRCEAVGGVQVDGPLFGECIERNAVIELD